MLTAVRLGGYVGILGVVFGVAWGAGAAFGPEPEPAPVATQHGAEHSGTGAHTAADGGAATALPAVAPGTDGLAAAAAGYSLAVERTAFTVGRTEDLVARLTGPDGKALTGYTARADGSEVRMLVVRKDASGLRVLTPQASGDGSWTAPLRLDSAGAWRAVVQFTPAGGTPLALGTDLDVPGDFQPAAPAPSRAAQADGYQVRLDGDLRPGSDSAIFATISKAGTGVTDLEPVGTAFGDIVAVREGDGALVPVQAQTRAAPDGRSGPGIAFSTTAPSEGVYRLYLRFHHDGEDHLVDFTVPTFGWGQSR